jgi:hypothetical protein
MIRWRTGERQPFTTTIFSKQDIIICEIHFLVYEGWVFYYLSCINFIIGAGTCRVAIIMDHVPHESIRLRMKQKVAPNLESFGGQKVILQSDNSCETS